jgi:uncharacterized protein (DUF2141 family)
MKTKLYSIFVMLGLALCFTNLFGQHSLQVTVRNIKESKGTIRVGLFNNADDFLKKAAYGKIVKAVGTEITVVFENLSAGDYAVSVIHDENENGELDKNFMGIPREGFAFGNNAMGTFGPPSFEKAKITIGKENLKQEVKLKYL